LCAGSALSYAFGMRWYLALLASATLLVLAVASCGARTGIGSSSNEEAGGAGGSSRQSSTSTSTSTGTGGVGGHGGCGKCGAATTCQEKGFNCGTVGDGCGCLIDCGTCTAPGELCGGSGIPNVCGSPCGTTSCATLGFDCGETGNGCESTLNCGTCPSGQFCGGGGPNKCGLGMCRTCAELGYTCGQQDDGCGNVIDCGTCPMGLYCGGGSPGKTGVCGVPGCMPLTCQDQGFNCGQATDKCGTVINCGSCAGNQICGEKAPNACGASGVCTNLCLQQMACPPPSTTSISGTVFAPNGVDPLYGVLVYVPNAPVLPFTPGVACGDCTSQVTGSPLVSAVTGPDGTFTISNMPVGANIPLVIQNGRWRRQFTIPSVAPCVNTPLTSMQIRMPQTQAEGDIPLMAFVTGGADTLECALRKMGIADSEFSDPSGNGRVRFYQGPGNGSTMPGAVYSPNTPSEDQLWGTQAAINAYDMVYFACQGARIAKSSAEQNVVINYANAGGRVFATHYSYVWLYNDPPFSMTANWMLDQTGMMMMGTGLIDTTFPKGLALAQWLQGLFPGATLGQIPLNAIRHDFDSANPPSQVWITMNDPDFPQPTIPMHYTFDTPVGMPADQQCGRVLFSDFHVEDQLPMMGGTAATFPTECSSAPMTAQEKMLEFMIFDLGSCVKLDVCKSSETCAQQNVACGPAPDGCGNILQCGNCPMGQVCIGGTCVLPCTPKTCAQQGFTCGMQDDTCGNVIACGSCPPNLACLDGTCNPGNCMPKSCGEQGFSCGPQGDGCGNIVQCGPCPTGAVCVEGKCTTPPCTQKTCSELGYDCGLATDGCDHAIDCGSCMAPTVCGGAKPNVCGI
jgi:hypothetical protein